MASKIPGVTGSHPSQVRADSATGHGSFHAAATTGGIPSLEQAKQHAMQAARAVAKAMGWNDANSTIAKFLGGDCFTAGVVIGMGENLAQAVVGAADLVKTLALAEYWESRHGHTFWDRFRGNLGLSALPGVGMGIAGGMDALSRFWPNFDRLAEAAFNERTALVEGLTYAFSHPKDVLLKLTQAQEAKFKQFAAYEAQRSLSGNFRAGVLFGELLLDLLMIIDLAAGLVALARLVPKLARYAEDLSALAREFRTVRAIKASAGDLAEPGPRLQKSVTRAGPAGGGGSPPVTPPATPTPSTILSGHGGWEPSSGTMVVPDGTNITFYSAHGGVITDPLGNAIETGQDMTGVFQRTYGPGDVIPDYTLSPPDGLNILGNPTTVATPTPLSSLLKPDMGCVHWAACTYDPTSPGSSFVFDTDKVTNEVTGQIHWYP